MRQPLLLSDPSNVLPHQLAHVHARTSADSEGLLQAAIGAPAEKKQEFLRHAADYLAFARKQDERSEATSERTELDRQGAEDQHRQVRQLIKEALDLPTPEEFEKFLDFNTSFRRLGVWNARMAYIQRPGARFIASEYEWKKVGRFVVPDAVPIIILWPSSPIRLVYELEDTGPPVEREPINDPFAVAGNFNPKALSALSSSLKKSKKALRSMSKPGGRVSTGPGLRVHTETQ